MWIDGHVLRNPSVNGLAWVGAWEIEWMGRVEAEKKYGKVTVLCV